MTRLRAAIEGNLEYYMDRELKMAEQAVWQGVRNNTEDLKRELRRETSSELGRRVAKTWRSRFWPQHDPSLGAAGMVWTNSEKIIDAFASGGVIRSKEGFWLAIPTDAAPKRGRGRKRITPSNFPEHRFGPLRFVYRRGKPGLLVVDNQRRTKAGNYTKSRSKKALSTGYGLSTVVMFTLHRQVRLRKRLDPQRAFSAAERRLAHDIDYEFRRLGGA